MNMQQTFTRFKGHTRSGEFISRRVDGCHGLAASSLRLRNALRQEPGVKISIDDFGADYSSLTASSDSRSSR